MAASKDVIPIDDISANKDLRSVISKNAMRKTTSRNCPQGPRRTRAREGAGRNFPCGKTIVDLTDEWPNSSSSMPCVKVVSTRWRELFIASILGAVMFSTRCTNVDTSKDICELSYNNIEHVSLVS